MMNPLQPAAGNDYQKEYQKLRTKRVAEILKSENMSNDDFVFLDNFIKTYFPDASKTLKNVLTQDALKKVFQGTQYKELDTDEPVFTAKEAGKYYILVVSGKVNIVEENESNPPLKSVSRGEVINPADIHALAQPNKEIKAVCAEKSEILMYEKDHYDNVIKEFASAANNNKLRGIAKHFLKIKKMDRSSKEEFLTYFKTEKFTKGTVITNIKSKVEEVYLIQTGKVVLVAPLEGTGPNNQARIVFGVLGPENIFNETPLIFERGSPYYAVCLEDVEVLSVGKTNLNFVTDPDSLSELRGNCQCRQRLQSTFLEKYQKMSKEEIEQNQAKLCEKAGFALKDLNEIFEKFDPKSKTSHQFAKNLEKFNKAFEKPAASNTLKQFNAGPLQKFSEFATPRLVSKDPNFRTLDPQRQLALLALRNEGANRRAGNVAAPKNLKDMNKDDIMKMQARLQNEEKMECEKIMEKKTISDKLNIKQPPVEENKSNASSLDDKKGLFNKMRMMDNSALLAKVGVGEKKEETPAPIVAETKPETPVEPNQSQQPAPIRASNDNADEAGLRSVRGNLASLLGVGTGPNVRPQQSDIINKKRTNLRNIL